MWKATFLHMSHSVCDYCENIDLGTQKDPGTGKWIPLLRASDHSCKLAFFYCR